MPIFAIVLVALCIGVIVFMLVQRARLLRRVQQALAAESAKQGALASALARLQLLEPLAGIVDAQAHARELIKSAEAEAARIRTTAAEEVAALRREGKESVDRQRQEMEGARLAAESQARRLQEESRKQLQSAELESRKIISIAHEKAKAIAGDAYAAMANVKELEERARALENRIEGYGDRYLIPTDGLIDQLAAEMGFTEAGQKLKAVRDRVRRLVTDEAAAACDYVENNRKETAVRFVLDAFNGKVEAILTEARHDNAGTLERKIRDAFSLVNAHGQAFRNARITSEYLDARVEELRWTVVVFELKLKDKEEQRQIKERIREEEKAQRDFERAQKEALKEEELLRKAMAKAQAEFDRASDAQKATYEAKLAALAAQLLEAEAKNQRALSMAQQTKAGHVYVISNVGSFGEEVFKIGMTRRLEPADRIKELGDASVPFDFDVHALIRSDDAPALERALHKQFLNQQVNKVNPRKEFFRLRLSDLRSAVEALGCQTSWTMLAEARDYRETLALEKALASTSGEDRRWAQRQLKELEARDAVVNAGAELLVEAAVD